MVRDVEILVLGPLEVRVEGEPVAIAGTRARTLLTRLALEPGRVVPASRLIDAVWDDEPPDGATNALQSLVARVRRVVPDCVETDSTGYRLVLSEEAVDAVRFERLAAQGRRSLADGNAGAAGAELRSALALWRGAALADAADAPFAVAAAARLEELRLGAIEDRVEADLATGGDGTLVAELEALVAEHPLRERMNAQLVRALAAEGRQADALAAFERLRTRLADELGIDPSEELRALQLAVLRGEAGRQAGALEPDAAEAPAAVRAAPRTNLRAQITSFVGREADIDRIESALQESRLVTLVGPGGSGKTRLASEVGVRLVDQTPAGVWMVELAPVGDPGELTQAFLSVFGARESGLLSRAAAGVATPEERLADAIGERDLVLVVDNCEHLVQAVATLTDALLARCPALRVLATSREPLGITGEVLLPIDPLPMPEADAEVGPVGAVDSPAVQLFTDRVRAVRPGFVVDDSNVRDVVAICRALDGMPLAIELAAARLRSLTTGQVADRLDDRFRLLGGGGGAALPRHQTLRAVVDWSWDLLTDQERAMLRRLAVFPGGATLEAAEAVCAGDAEPPEDVLYLLASLVDKSLVNSATDQAGGEVRYTMLDTIRAYADERRLEAGEDAAFRRRHAEYLADLAETADAHLRAPQQLVWLARLTAERDNLHAAIRWALDSGETDLAVRLVVFLGWFWFMRGARSEALEFSERALKLPGTAPKEYRAGVLVIRGMLGITGGTSFDQALARAEEAVELIATLPDEILRRFPMLETTEMLVSMFRANEQRTLELARERFDSPDRWVAGISHLVAGQVVMNVGEIEQATAEFEASVRDFRAVGDQWGIGNALVAVGDLAAMRGEGDAASAALAEAQEAFRLLDDREDIAQLMIKAAMQRTQAGDIERATTELDAAQAIAEDLGADEWMLYVNLARADLARAQGKLDEAKRLLDGAIESFWGYGRAMYPLLGLLLVGRGRVELADGDLDGALEWYRRAVRAGLDGPDYPVVARAVEFRGDMALADGDAELAASLLGTAEVLRGMADRADLDVQRVRAAARAALGDRGYDRAYRRGASRRRADVLEELDAEAPPSRSEDGAS